MIVGIPKESFPGERRVALVPALVPRLKKAGIDCRIESGAGADAGFPDAAYVEKGAAVSSRAEVFQADVVIQVRTYGANPVAGRADLKLLRKDQALIGFAEPLGAPGLAEDVAQTGAVLLALELMPRITRAQSMDAMSSMATVVGYKAVILAAERLPKIFPLMMTAAGTVAPAHTLIVGAGVAGLQAIATARRLGSVVHAYDVRPAVKEQVLSLGAKFVELPIEAGGAEGAGGYARDLGADFYRRLGEQLATTVAACDVVITTAAVPGKKSPVLITRAMVERMRPGSVIIDLAAERGGNCELTRADETVLAHGVTILGPLNLAATVANDASQMFGRNILTYLLHLTKDGQLSLDHDDEIVRGTLVSQGGQVVHPQVRGLLDGSQP